MFGSGNHGWLVVGLGNPGPKYARTRHNAGARFVDVLQKAGDFPAWTLDRRTHALVSVRGSRASPGPRPRPHNLALASPQTWMNASGEAAARLVRKYRVSLNQVIVAHDDKDIPLGLMKLQRNRSAAGHKGVQSVMDALGTQDFWRLRIGIGVPRESEATEDFVLAPFTAAEARQLQETVFPQALTLLHERLGLW